MSGSYVCQRSETSARLLLSVAKRQKNISTHKEKATSGAWPLATMVFVEFSVKMERSCRARARAARSVGESVDRSLWLQGRTADSRRAVKTFYEDRSVSAYQRGGANFPLRTSTCCSVPAWVFTHQCSHHPPSLRLRFSRLFF